MKKLIVFSVIFAMLATVAFAEVSVGAWGKGVATLMGGMSEEDGYKAPIIGNWGNEFRAEFSAENEEGSFGGHFKVWLNNGNDTFGWVWWQPIEQVKLWIGHNPWAEFGADDIVGWGFNAGANDGGVTTDRGDFTAAFNHGFGDKGLALSIFPMQGLAINVAIPYGRDVDVTDRWDYFDQEAADYYGGNFLGDIFGNMMFQVRYDIENLGRAVVTFKLGPGYRKSTTGKESWFVDESLDPAGLYAGFLFTAIENLTVNAGLGAKFPMKVGKDASVAEGTYFDSFNIGLGAEYVMGDFGVKARVAMGFGAGVKYEGASDKVKEGMTFALAVLPYYDLGILKAYLNAGIDIKGKDAVGSEKADYTNTFGFYINPYISKSVGSGTFYAGFKLAGFKDKGKDTETVTSWGVPIGITFGF